MGGLQNNSSHSYGRYQMEMSGQLHAPTAIPGDRRPGTHLTESEGCPTSSLGVSWTA